MQVSITPEATPVTQLLIRMKKHCTIEQPFRALINNVETSLSIREEQTAQFSCGGTILPKGHLWTHSESAVHLNVWDTLSSLVNTGFFQLCKMQSRLGSLHLTKASFLRDKPTKKKPQWDKTKAISWGSCCNLLPTHGCQLLPASLLPTPVVRQGRGPSWTLTTPTQRFSAGWISSHDLTD